MKTHLICRRNCFVGCQHGRPIGRPAITQVDYVPSAQRLSVRLSDIWALSWEPKDRITSLLFRGTTLTMHEINQLKLNQVFTSKLKNCLDFTLALLIFIMFLMVYIFNLSNLEVDLTKKTHLWPRNHNVLSNECDKANVKGPLFRCFESICSFFLKILNTEYMRHHVCYATRGLLRSDAV